MFRERGTKEIIFNKMSLYILHSLIYYLYNVKSVIIEKLLTFQLHRKYLNGKSKEGNNKNDTLYVLN